MFGGRDIRPLPLFAAGLFALALFSSPAAAERSYLGFRVWKADWTVGVVEKLREDQARSIPLGSGTDIENARAGMTTLGIMAGYLSGDWALNYSGSLGSAAFDINRTFIQHAAVLPLSGNFYFPSTARVRVERSDHDLVYKRLLGDGGWDFFLGLKFQAFEYASQSRPTMGGLEEFQTNAMGDTLLLPAIGFVNSAFVFRSRAIGPAGGLGYTRALNPKHTLSGAVGLLYLRGSLKNDSVQAILESRDRFEIPGNTQVILLRTGVDEEFDAPGATFNLVYSYAVGPGAVLQLSLLRQMAVFRTRKSHLTDYLIGNTIGSLFGLEFQPLFTARTTLSRPGYDNALDTYTGLSFAMIFFFGGDS